MSTWTPQPDTVVHDPARAADGVLIGHAPDGSWRLAGHGSERWNTERIQPAAQRPIDEFGFQMPHPLRPWDMPDAGWRQGVVPSATLL